MWQKRGCVRYPNLDYITKKQTNIISLLSASIHTIGTFPSL
jgi:hypothetical protein